MPQAVPACGLMIKRNEWPQLRAATPIRDAVRILLGNLVGSLSEEKKIAHGNSTPLVPDDEYNLFGFIRLTDLLRSIRHLCDDPDKACNLDEARGPVSAPVIPFAGRLSSDEGVGPDGVHTFETHFEVTLARVQGPDPRGRAERSAGG